MATPFSPIPLRILHTMRAPVGGLFRHVLDLANEQAADGHFVGILADKSATDALTGQKLNAIAPKLKLGLSLIAMRREPGLADMQALASVYRIARALDLDVLHGHGAKGGTYARLAAAMLSRRGGRARSFYTPHGGTLHFEPGTLKGTIYLGAERRLSKLSSGIVFESDYARRIFARKIGDVSCPVRVIPNGVRDDDFEQACPGPDAADFVFIGELRHLKGVDVLLRALRALADKRPVSAVIVGAGPDQAQFHTLARELGLDGVVRFPGAMPARQAFGLGRCLVVPSRAESFPYVILEAGAARLPVIATDVGGIPEMVAGTGTTLVPVGDVAALEAQMADVLDRPDAAHMRAAALNTLVAEKFTARAMHQAVLAFYGEVLGA